MGLLTPEQLVAQRTYIKDLTPNQLIQGMFAIQNCQLGLTRQGKPYLKCLIADKTGRLPARMWSADEAFVQSLPPQGFVVLEGQTQPYQGQLQVIVQKLDVARPTDDDLPHLLPATDRDVEQMFDELADLVRSVQSPSLRALVEAYLQDQRLMSAFKQAPAAVMLHHAYLGGLLEHTLGLVRLADKMLGEYPQLNRDLVLVGLFIHDLGKCAELVWREGFGYSDEGQLIGHIVRGATWLERKAEACAKAGHPLPKDALMVLEHIILSHHGKPEFGAARCPSTPEALFVSLLDNLDAKMHMAITSTRGLELSEAELNGNFTDKMWALDNVRLSRPDPMAGECPPPTPAAAAGSQGGSQQAHPAGSEANA